MANLIITIISIALVAVAALMAIFYGGSAFTSSTAQARANLLAEQAKQIVAAWQLWTANNGGNGTAISSNCTLSTMPALVPQYLSEWFFVPQDIARPNGTWPTGYENWKLANNSNGSCTSPDMIVLNIVATDFGYQICRRLSKLYDGPNAEPSINTGSSAVRGRPVCYYGDTNANTQYDSGEAIAFRWVVF